MSLGLKKQVTQHLASGDLFFEREDYPMVISGFLAVQRQYYFFGISRLGYTFCSIHTVPVTVSPL